MKVLKVHKECSRFDSYRTNRVSSLFNAEYGHKFDLEIESNIDEQDWQIGVIVGPSGSGKSSLGEVVFDGNSKPYDLYGNWDSSTAIVDSISETASFDAITASLSAVGLGSVPSWLKPFNVLSNGEQFRAGMARLLLSDDSDVVIDEFTSVIDRQIAKIGASAFAKGWRRESKTRRVVLLTPHYDILPWVRPDWVIDTKEKSFARGCLRRPQLELKIKQVSGKRWSYFEPHYYLDLPRPIAAHYFVGFIDGEPVAHLVVCPFFQCGYYRATRLVVMPEWQGAGVGVRFLNAVCQWHLDGNGRRNRQLPVLFHTSHPQLAAALRRDKLWVQKSANLHGGKPSSLKSLNRGIDAPRVKYGGHFRAVQGFAYVG